MNGPNVTFSEVVRRDVADTTLLMILCAPLAALTAGLYLYGDPINGTVSLFACLGVLAFAWPGVRMHRYTFDGESRELRIEEARGRNVETIRRVCFTEIESVSPRYTAIPGVGLGEQAQLVIRFTDGSEIQPLLMAADRAEHLADLIDDLTHPKLTDTERPIPIERVTAELEYCVSVLRKRQFEDTPRAWLWKIKQAVAEQRIEAIESLHGPVTPATLDDVQRQKLHETHPLLQDERVERDTTEQPAGEAWRQQIQNSVASYLAARPPSTAGEP